jgi:RNA recognition motif-containing protein
MHPGISCCLAFKRCCGRQEFSLKQSATAKFSAKITKLSERSAGMKIYVGNLPYELTEQELRQEFEAFGTVSSVSIITDRYTGRSKGFAFVEMPTVSEGRAAITGLDGKALKDQTLRVNAARPSSDNRGGGSYGNRRPGGGPRKGGWKSRY